jgi:hypothetical protein
MQKRRSGVGSWLSRRFLSHLLSCFLSFFLSFLFVFFWPGYGSFETAFRETLFAPLPGSSVKRRSGEDAIRKKLVQICFAKEGGRQRDCIDGSFAPPAADQTSSMLMLMIDRSIGQEVNVWIRQKDRA